MYYSLHLVERIGVILLNVVQYKHYMTKLEFKCLMRQSVVTTEPTSMS